MRKRAKLTRRRNRKKWGNIVLELIFKKLHPDAVIPSYAHTDDSGFDLSCVEDGEITFGVTSVIPTGLAVAPPPRQAFVIYTGHNIWLVPEIQIRSRSGLAVREGITCLTGTIDNTYRGEIRLVLTRMIPGVYKYKKGERLAQGVVGFVSSSFFSSFLSEETLPESFRGKNGFGSTGI
jgi:dUTP pyrophosphatase